MASYKDYTKKPKLLPDPVTPPATPTPQPLVVPSNYKPQQYNKQTGQVEDVGAPGVISSRRTLQKTDLRNIPISSGEQIVAKELQRQREAAIIASLQPPVASNVDPTIASQIGQINTNDNLSQDPLMQSIAKNADARKQENILTADKITVGNVISPLISPNKVTGLIAKLPLGTSVINALSTNRKTREYLSDYSNADNLASIRKNIGTSNEQISDMISNAKLTENTPENNKVTQTIYNDAMQRKYNAIAKLKKIAETDQRAYTDTIKDDLVELELYFNGDPSRGVPPGKFADDYALYAALNKPTPKYLQGGQ